MSDPPPMIGQAGFALDGEQVVIPAFLVELRHIVGEQVIGLGAGAGAVLEDEAVLEAGRGDQVASALEGLLGLAAEADDEIEIGRASCRERV